MRLIIIALLVLIASCLMTASAVRVGGGIKANLDPISIGGPSSNVVAIHYDPVGYHIMMPSILPQQYSPGLMNLSSGVRYFGRDFQLGMIDDNYAGAPFLIQVLADP